MKKITKKAPTSFECTCHNCGTQFIYDINDVTHAIVTCPHCEYSIKHDIWINRRVPEHAELINQNAEKTHQIMDTFEAFLDSRGLSITCEDSEEEQERLVSAVPASIYGMEYWNLVDKVESILNERSEKENRHDNT